MSMSVFDKVSGRVKKATGSLLGDRALRREGVNEERKADAKEELARQEEELERQAARVADLERRSGGRPPR
jgi:uncharacterized protein YjbJ (UPF0337 family)